MLKLLLGAFVCFGFCFTQTAVRAQQPEPACADVPVTPPDSTPHEYETFDDTTSAGERLSAPVLRDIVVLQFRRGTPHTDKVAAICLVDGRVVGGYPLWKEGEGIYLVRIPGDRMATTLFKAIDELRRLPQVLYAGPETILHLRDTQYTEYYYSTS